MTIKPGKTVLTIFLFVSSTLFLSCNNKIGYPHPDHNQLANISKKMHNGISIISLFLNEYQQHQVTPADYVKLLRMYTRQHYLPDSSVNLVENYDPNLGGPIVYYYWSNHYNHSSFNNLVITGLCGIRPSEGDTLTLHPLADSTIEYFYLDDAMYHGHKLSVIFDRNGEMHKMGKGLTVLVDGKKVNVWQANGKYKAIVAKVILSTPAKQPENAALNILRKNYPVPSALSTPLILLFSRQLMDAFSIFRK